MNGQRIYEWRKKSGLTQEEFGNALGVSRQTVSKWELDKANPEPEKLSRMEELFGERAAQTQAQMQAQAVCAAPAKKKSRRYLAILLPLCIVFVGLAVALTLYLLRDLDFTFHRHDGERIAYSMPEERDTDGFTLYLKGENTLVFSGKEGVYDLSFDPYNCKGCVPADITVACVLVNADTGGRETLTQERLSDGQTPFSVTSELRQGSQWLEITVTLPERAKANVAVNVLRGSEEGLRFAFTGNGYRVARWDYSKSGGFFVAVPSEYNGKPVTEIGEAAFANSDVCKVYLPDSVTRIDARAFGGCGQLTFVRLGGAKTIGENAFYACDALRRIALPSTVEEVQTVAFSYCASLEEISVEGADGRYRSEEGVLIDAQAGAIVCYPKGKKSQRYVTPQGVTSIADSAFYECDLLEEIVFSQGLTCVGENAFFGCERLAILRIPKGMSYIKSTAFDECMILSEVYFDGTQEDLSRIYPNIVNGYFAGKAFVHYLPEEEGAE